MSESVTLRFRFATVESAFAFVEGFSLLRREGDPTDVRVIWDDGKWNVDIGPTTNTMGFGPLDVRDGVAVCATYPY